MRLRQAEIRCDRATDDSAFGKGNSRTAETGTVAKRVDPRDVGAPIVIAPRHQMSSRRIVVMTAAEQPRQFVEIFERHGFEVLDVHAYARVAVGEDLRSRFVEPFRSMPLEDLGVTQARFFVRKR